MTLQESIFNFCNSRLIGQGLRLDGRNQYEERAIYYRLRVDDNGNVFEREWDLGPDYTQEISRGRGAFRVDLLVWEEVNRRVVPRVVVEVKTGLSTHELLTVSSKAEMHKQTYPYLRYGLALLLRKRQIDPRYLEYGQLLDFIYTFSSQEPSNDELEDFYKRILRQVEISKYFGRYFFDSSRDAPRAKAVIKDWLVIE